MVNNEKRKKHQDIDVDKNTIYIGVDPEEFKNLDLKNLFSSQNDAIPLILKENYIPTVDV